MILKKKKKCLHSDWVGIFFSKFRWSSKKKRSSTRPKPSVSDLNYIKSLTNSHRQCQWGAILVFGAKIGLKSNKNGVFCILFRAMGWEGCRPPPPWLRYCLQLHLSTKREPKESSLSRPRTGMLEAKDTSARVLKKKVFKNFFSGDLKKKKAKRSSQWSPKEKKVFTKIFQAISRKTHLPKNFSGTPKILTIQKIVLSSSRGQANFRGLEASRPKPRPRTWPSKPRSKTSKCVLEAKDFLEDSTSES